MTKQFYFKHFRLACHLFVLRLNVKEQFKCQTVLFDPTIGPFQKLPLRVIVYPGAMAMMKYSALPKAPALLELYHQSF